MATVNRIMMAVIGVFTIYSSVFFINCGTLKDIGRTANDAARILCELVATEQSEDLESLSPEEWCSIRKNLDPFIDEVLSAKMRASDKHGFNRAK